jgi:hypothetical protein
MRRYSPIALCGLLISLATASAQQAKSGADVVPSTSFAFVSIRVSDLRDVEALKPIREAIAKLEKGEFSVEKELGVPLDEIDRLTLFWPAVPSGPDSAAPYIVVTTKGNYNEAKVLKALRALPPSSGRHRGRGEYGAGSARPAVKSVDFAPSDSRVPKAPAIDLKGPEFPGKDVGPGPGTAPPLPPKGPPKALQELGAQVGDPPPVVKGQGRAEPVADETPADGPELFFRDHPTFPAVFLLDNRTLLLIPSTERGPEAVLTFLGQLLRRKSDGPLAEAIAEAGKHTIVAAARVQPIEEMIRHEGDFPRELVPFRSLLKAKTAVITADVAAKTTVTAKLTFADAATARRAEPVLKTLIQHGVDALADLRKEVARNTESAAVMTPLIDLASAALDKAEVNADGAIVSARVEAEVGPTIAKAMAALPDLMEIGGARAKTQNNLKQIGLACHNYHDTMGQFPSNFVGPDGKVLFSWRVAILPFIEQDNMWKQLDMTKPWDDPQNAKVLEKMPDVFRVYGRDAEKGKTYLQMPYSPQQVPGGSPFLVAGRRTSFANITDGLSNTIAVVEAADAVNWAKPDDLLFDPKKAPKVGDPSRKWFHALFGDGAVRILHRDKLTDDQLWALMTIDGGEVVEIPNR